MLGGIDAQVAHGIVHLAWPGRAVHAENVNVKWLERGQGSSDLCPQQHAARGFECHLDGDRKALPCFLHGVGNSDHGGLGLQQILASLDQQHVHSTLDQGERLLLVGRSHIIEFDMAKRR